MATVAQANTLAALHGMIVAQTPLPARTLDPNFGPSFYANFFQGHRLWPSVEIMVSELLKTFPNDTKILANTPGVWLQFWNTNDKPETPAIAAHLFWALAAQKRPIDSIGYFEAGAVDDAIWRLKPNPGFMLVGVYAAGSDRRINVGELFNIIAKTASREVFTKIRLSADPKLNQGQGKFVAGEEE